MNYDLIQAIIGGIGLITIFLLWWQIKSELKWKKISFSIDKVNLELFKKNQKIIDDFGIDMSQSVMSDEEYSKIMNDENVGILNAIREILNELEMFATLYNMSVLNKNYSYESYSDDMIVYYNKFQRIIDYYCDKYDPFYYKNLRKCAEKFIKITKKEKIKIEKYNKQIKKKYNGIID
jgi:hypothetical protein